MQQWVVHGRSKQLLQQPECAHVLCATDAFELQARSLFKGRSEMAAMCDESVIIYTLMTDAQA